MLSRPSLEIAQSKISLPHTQVRRLVVLVPFQEFDELRFSRAIRTLAGPYPMEFLLVTVVSEAEYEMKVRRRLATLSTYIRDSQFIVSTRALWGKSWPQALRQELRPGDLLVYPPELMVPDSLFKRQPLESVLLQLDTPLYPLPGYFEQAANPWRPTLQGLAYWGVIALLLGLFLYLENAASTSFPGALGHILAILIVVGEFGAVYLWTAIAG